MPGPDADPLVIRAEDGAHGVVDPDAGLEVTYTPDPGYVGTDTFSFVASDGAFAAGARTMTIKGVALTLTSSEAGTAKLTLTTGKNTTTKSTKLAGGTTKLTLKLSAKARKALKRKRRVKATLTVVASDAAANAVTKKLSLTLRS